MRIAWVDNARAIGILLVVVGHAPGLSPVAWRIIYSFHMPLFFFISGYLLQTSGPMPSKWRFLKRVGQSLLLPYLFFGLLSYIYWLPTHTHGTLGRDYASLGPLDPLYGLAYGTIDRLYANRVLWFFPCLFCTACLFFAVARIRSLPVRWFILVEAALLGLYLPTFLGAVRLPWNLDAALVALLFYASGHFFRERGEAALAGRGERWMSWILLPFAFAICVGVALSNAKVEMSIMAFGSPVLFLIAAYAGILATTFISRALPATGVARWLSHNTIIVFPLHPILFGMFTALGVLAFGQPYSFKLNPVFCPLYVLGALACCVPLAYVFRRFAPWLTGRATGRHSEAAVSHGGTEGKDGR